MTHAYTKNILLLLLFPLLFINGAKATHVMGGDLTYRHLHDSTYELTFLIYRDCAFGNAQIDDDITYWVYYKSNKNVFINNRTVDLYNNTTESVDPEAPNCVTPSGLCIESGKYIDTVVLGSDPKGYIVTWYRLERNHAIDNLKRCQSSSSNTNCNGSFNCTNRRNPFGMVWTAEIPSWKFKNSSPQFLSVPVPYFCTGVNNSFNHVVFDPDGDSLSFKIVTPLSPEQCLRAAPNPSSSNSAPSYGTIYKNVVYQSGYSTTRPFGSSSSPISINAVTGEMRAKPLSSGNYVIAVLIEEWRVNPVTKKREYLGSIRRDLQFIAGSCPSNSPPTYTKVGNSTYRVDPGDTLEFDIAGKDANDTVYLTSKGNIYGGLGSTIDKPYARFNDTSGFKSVQQTFRWLPTCDHITYTSPHVVTITLSDEGCNAIQRTYSIFVNSRPILRGPELTCLEIRNNSSIRLRWDTLKNVPYFKAMHIYRIDKQGNKLKVKSFTDSTIVSWTDNSVSNATTDFYKYFITVENECDLEGVPSDSLSTVQMSVQEVNDKSLRFRWNRYGHGRSYRYVLQKLVGTNFLPLDSTFDTSLVYSSCGLNTDYRLLIQDTSSGALNCTIYSQTVSSSTKDSIGPDDPAKLLNSSVLSWTSIQLRFLKSPTSDATSYRIWRSANGAAYKQAGLISSSADTIDFTDNSGLNTNTKRYQYLIVAIDSCGNAGDSSNVHQTVNLTVSAGQLSARLNWDTYEGYSTIDSQWVERYDTLNSNWYTAKRLGATDTTFEDTSNILCNFTYTYRIRTFGDGSYFNLSDSEQVVARDTIRPQDVDILFATNNDDTSTTVSFKKVKAQDVNSYLIITLEYNSGQLIGTSLTNVPSGNDDTLSVNVTTSRTDSRRYCFRVFAVDSCNQNFSLSSEQHCPPFLRVQARNLNTRLSWTSYEGVKINQYVIQRYESGNWINHDTVASNFNDYVDQNLNCNQRYQYRILAVENGGINSRSNDVFATPFDTIKPVSPIIARATVLSDSSTAFYWNPSTSADVDSYEVFVSYNENAFQRLTGFKSPTGTTPFSFTHLNIDTRADTHAYRLIAIDSCSSTNRSVNNRYHQTVNISGEAKNLQNSVAWSDYKGFQVKQYDLLAKTGYNGNWSVLKTFNPGDSNYTHDNLYCFDTIRYRIRIIEDATIPDTSWSDTVRLKPFDTISPEPPVIKSVNVLNNGFVEISWYHSTSDDANQYIIFREDSAGKYTALDTLLNLFRYVDRTVSADTSWCYSLKAIDSCIGNISYRYSTPACILNIKLTPVGCENKVTIEWDDYKSFEQGVGGYEVYRITNSNSPVRIAQLGPNANSYVSNVSPYINYQYRIVAIEDGNTGQRAGSIWTDYSEKQYRTYVPPIYSASKLNTSTTQGEVAVQWEDQSGKAFIEYSRLYGKENGQSSYNLLLDNISPGTTSYTHKGLNTKTGDYAYLLVNVDSCGNISDTFSIHKTMDMELDYGQLVHRLSWTPYEGDTVVRYVLQRLYGSVFQNEDSIAASDTAFRKFPAPCNARITYRIMAELSNGYISYSDTSSGIAIDSIPPDAPELQNISALDSNRIELTFKGGDSLDIFAYSVNRSRNAGPFLHQGFVLFSSPGSQASYTDSFQMEQNQLHYFLNSLDSCVNTRSSDTFRLIQLTGTAGNFENHLTWRPFEGYTVGNYRLQYFDGNSWQQIASQQANDTTFTHSGIGCNRGLYYRVIGTEAQGNRTTYSNWIKLVPFDTISPSKPAIELVSIRESKLVDIRWEHDFNSDIKWYRLYRKDQSGNQLFLDSILRNGTYVDTVQAPSVNRYSYLLESIDSCESNHISPLSDSVNTLLFTYERDTCIPTVTLNWNSVGNIGDGTDAYRIYRSTDSLTYNLIANVSADSLRFIDTTTMDGRRYFYRVAAYDNGKTLEAFSDSQSFMQFIRPLIPAPFVQLATVSNTGVIDGTNEIKWEKLNKQDHPYLIGYRVFRADTVSGDYRISHPGIIPYGDSVSVHDSIDNQTDHHYYRVTSVNTCGQDGDSSLLHAPVQLKVENLNLASQLEWSEYYGFPVDSYEIHSAVESGPMRRIATVPGTQFSFTDRSVKCGTRVYFRVLAVSNDGRLSRSDLETVIGFDTTKPEPVAIRSVTVDPLSEELVLNWDSSASTDVKHYVIRYRRFETPIWDTLENEVLGTQYSTDQLKLDSLTIWEFQVSPVDSCGNSQTEFSAPHHQISLDASDQNAHVLLRWNNYQGWTVDSFRIYRDGAVYDRVIVQGARPDSVFNYLDSNIDCQSKTYEYRVTAFGSNGSISNSNSDTVTAFDLSIPSGVYLKTVTVVRLNEGVRLNWTKSFESDKDMYAIYRRGPGNDSLKRIGQTSAQNETYVDSSWEANGLYCYAIAVRDACENVGSMSNVSCPVWLSGGALEQANSLEWTAYQGWNDSIASYTVQKRQSDGSWLGIKELEKRIRAFVDDQLEDTVSTYCYRILAKEKAGGFEAISLSNTFCIDQRPRLFIPNAFTPGNDGLNETFKPLGAFIPENFTIRVFNRWGQMLHFSEEGEAWDGRDIEGNVHQTDKYFYIIEYKDLNGETIVRSGTVVLVR